MGNTRAELEVKIPQRGLEAGQAGEVDTHGLAGRGCSRNRVQWSMLEHSKSDPREPSEHSSQVTIHHHQAAGGSARPAETENRSGSTYGPAGLSAGDSPGPLARKPGGSALLAGDGGSVPELLLCSSLGALGTLFPFAKPLETDECEL